MSILNPSNLRILEDLLGSFLPYAKEQYGYEQSPTIRFAKDPDNAKNPLGKTGYYEPEHSRITIYIDGRHPKDIMRSISHELVHHAQNVRGDLAGTQGVGEQGYAQNNEHLREMEREAYERGNLCFRDWEDGIKSENPNMYESLKRNLKESQFAATASEEAQKINSQAGIHLNTEQEYWERVGIRTGEELAIEILTGTYNDMYKSVYGFRPRHSFSSVEDVQAAIEVLDGERDELDYDDAEDYRKNQELIASLMPNEMDVEYDKLPKQSGMGRAAMQEHKEELNMFDRRDIKLNQRLMESFGYKLKEEAYVGEGEIPVNSGQVASVGFKRGYYFWRHTNGLMNSYDNEGKFFMSLRDAGLGMSEANELLLQINDQQRQKAGGIQDGGEDEMNPEDDYNWVGHRAHYQESLSENYQVGDYVKIVDGGLRGAAGKIIEPITLVTGEQGFVVLLDTPADKRVFGQAGDELPVAADKLAPPVGHRARYQEGYGRQWRRHGEDKYFDDYNDRNQILANQHWRQCLADAEEHVAAGTVDQERMQKDEAYQMAVEDEMRRRSKQQGLNEGSMAEYGKIDAEDGNPPSKIGQGTPEYMKAYNAVLIARGEEPLPIVEPDQAYVDALQQGKMKPSDHSYNLEEGDGEMPRMESGPGGVEIFIPGLGTMSEQGGAPIYLEKNGNSWELLVWSDISSEDPTHRIDLTMAAESGNLQEDRRDFMGSDEEKEMMSKMSAKDHYKYVTQDRGRREMSPDEINAIESFNNWLNDEEADDYHMRQMTWEPAQSYRGGRVLAYNKKEGTWLDVMSDMPVSDKEMSDILPEAKLQAALKAKLAEVFAKHPQLASNKDFINTIKEGVKNKIMENKDMKKLNKDFGTKLAEGVVSKLKERYGEDEFGSMFDSYDDDEDEMGMEPSPEEEEIEALLRQYGLSKDSGPADDAAAGAAAMADMEDDADLGRRPEDDDEDPARRATVMKEDDGEYAHLGIKTTQDQYGPLHILPGVQFTGDLAADIRQIQQNDELDSWLYGELGSDESITDAAGEIVYAGADVQDHVGAEEDYDGSYQPRMAESNDEDGDGDVDSDDYMAKKDKAIKKAMGKEEDDKKEESFDRFHSDKRNTRLNEALMNWATK